MRGETLEECAFGQANSGCASAQGSFERVGKAVVELREPLGCERATCAKAREALEGIAVVGMESDDCVQRVASHS